MVAVGSVSVRHPTGCVHGYITGLKSQGRMTGGNAEEHSSIWKCTSRLETPIKDADWPLFHGCAHARIDR